MMMSLHYGILTYEGIFTTSVGFDPVIESYANFGYLGVMILAILMGFFLGWVTRLTINVPMLSFGFLFGVLVIGTILSSWNTMGVFVTSTWQSFLALAGLSLVMMDKLDNPVWKYYAAKLAEKLRLKGKDPKIEKVLKQAETATGRDSGVQGLSETEVVAGNGSLVAGSGTAPVPQRHERPKRFIYGK